MSSRPRPDGIDIRRRGLVFSPEYATADKVGLYPDRIKQMPKYRGIYSRHFGFSLFHK